MTRRLRRRTPPPIRRMVRLGDELWRIEPDPAHARPRFPHAYLVRGPNHEAQLQFREYPSLGELTRALEQLRQDVLTTDPTPP